MISITQPYNSFPDLALDLGEHEWHLGDGPYPFLDSPWVSDKLRDEIHSRLLPKHYLSALEKREKAFQPPPLHWVWGSKFESVLRGIEAVLEEIVEEAECDPYVVSWRNKSSFLNELIQPPIDWAACIIAQRFGDPYAMNAWEQQHERTKYRESVTGRIYGSGGIPWAQIAAKNRASLVKLKENQSIWECDLVSAEPSLMLTIQNYSTNSNLSINSGFSINSGHEELDAYEILTRKFRLPVLSDRSQTKQMIMSALYGAGRNRMKKWGVTEQAFAEMSELRLNIKRKIQEEFDCRTWGGKKLQEDFELSHWVQGSAADIAFDVFTQLAPKLQEEGTKPFATIHDGTLWLANKNWQPKEEYKTLISTTFANKNIHTHKAKIRWKRLR